MRQFEEWLATNTDGTRPIFVGFNAPFDWMFVADYFWRYLGRNPFGISALDLKSYYMGRDGVERWAETSRQYVCATLGLGPDRTHNALDDAREQALLARVLMGRAGSRLKKSSPNVSFPLQNAVVRCGHIAMGACRGQVTAQLGGPAGMLG